MGALSECCSANEVLAAGSPIKPQGMVWYQMPSWSRWTHAPFPPWHNRKKPRHATCNPKAIAALTEDYKVFMLILWLNN